MSELKEALEQKLQKEAIFGATRAYHNTIGKNPSVEASVVGALGTVGGYHGSNLLAKSIAKALTANLPPEQREAELRKLEQDGTLSTVRNVGGTLGGLAGLAYVLHNRADFKHGVGGFLGSMKDEYYWDRHPDRAKIRDKGVKKHIKGAAYDPNRVFQKTSAYSMNPGFGNNRIPISYTTDLLAHNPFIELQKKEQAINIVTSSENADSGVTTGKKILQAGIKAGVGFGASYLLANTIGSVVNLPDGIRKNLNMAAGVTGALDNAGMFKF